MPDRDKDRHEAGCTGRCHFQPYRNGRHPDFWKVSASVHHQHCRGQQGDLVPRREQSRAHHLDKRGSINITNLWSPTCGTRWCETFSWWSDGWWHRHRATWCSFRTGRHHYWRPHASWPATHTGAPRLPCSKVCRTLHRWMPIVFGRVCERSGGVQYVRLRAFACWWVSRAKETAQSPNPHLGETYAKACRLWDVRQGELHVASHSHEWAGRHAQAGDGFARDH